MPVPVHASGLPRSARRRAPLAVLLSLLVGVAAVPASASAPPGRPDVGGAVAHEHGEGTAPHDHGAALPEPDGSRPEPVAAATHVPDQEVLRAVPYQRFLEAGFAFSQLVTDPDLSIRGIELTQAIQCFDTSTGLASCADNALPLATGKSSAARIYVRSVPFRQSSVPVRLFYRLVGQPWSSVMVSGPGTPSLSRAAADSLNVFFTQVGSSATGEFYAVVDPDGVVAESDESNNRFPATGVTTVRFERTRDLPVVGRRLDYHPSGYSGTRQAGGWAVNGGGTQWWNRVLPVREGGVTNRVASGYLDWTSEVTSGDGQHALIASLNLQWVFGQIPWLFGPSPMTGARHVYGWVPQAAGIGGHADMPVYPHAGGLGVVGLGTDTPGTSTDDPGRGAVIFGHELTHDYDVKHTATADSCNSQDSSSDWPYSTSGIQEFGFNTATGAVYAPAESHDLMSYCPPGSRKGWISPFTWQRMHDRLRLSAVAAAEDGAGAAAVRSGDQEPPDAEPAAEWVVVDATLTREGEGRLGTLYAVPDGRELGTDDEGPWAVRLLDAEGGVVGEHRFTATFESEYHHEGEPEPGSDADRFRDGPREAGAALVLPLRGADSVVLGRLDDEGGFEALDRRVMSSSAPQVSAVEADSPRWEPGSRHVVSWSGSDADGDDLTWMLLASRDDGASWDLLAGPTRETSAELATDSLAGGRVLFRAVASDGLRVASGLAAATVAVPDQAPTATVVQPAPGRTVAEGGLLVLEGTGTDLEDGALEGDALRWTVEGREVGRGGSALLTDLAPGRHTVVLTATDSAGGTGTASTDVLVTRVAAVAGDAVLEGDAVQARSEVTDPQDERPLTCRVQYGDGSAEAAGTLSGGTCTGPVHRYRDDGTYEVTTTALAGEDVLGADTASQVVRNAAPVVGPGGELVGGVGAPLELSLGFTDAGVDDVHEARVDWGDGTVEQVALEQRSGGGTVRAAHAYATAGVRTVVVTVTDDDGGTGTQRLDAVAVDRGPGRVTGGVRWGSDQQLEAQVRYASGATAPSGQTRYRVDGRRFVAGAFSWLAVEGSRATWSATGTLDGAPGHRLLVAVEDRGPADDRVRVRLSDPSGAVLSDTQPGAAAAAAPSTPVRSGNLTVHR